MRFAILVAVILIAVGGLAVVVLRHIDRSRSHGPADRAANSSPSPSTTPVNRSRFSVVAFPRPRAVGTGDGSGFSLRRAVLLRLDEIDPPAKEVSVRDGETERFVRIDDLTFFPPGDAASLMAGLNDAIQSWGDATDWRRVKMESEGANVEGSTPIVTLYLTDKRVRTIEFRYSHSE